MVEIGFKTLREDMKIVSNLFSKNCRRKKLSKEVRIKSHVLILKNTKKGRYCLTLFAIINYVKMDHY